MNHNLTESLALKVHSFRLTCETNKTFIALDYSGTPYVVFNKWVNNQKATVMKFNGTDWMNVGSTAFSAEEAEYLCVAMDDSGTPYVVFKDNGNSEKATVMKFSGTDWVNVGSPGFSAGEAWYTSIAMDSGSPYVAYTDWGNSNGATVMKFDGTDWVNVGRTGFSAGTSEYTSIAIDGNGAPYIAYINGGAWAQWFQAQALMAMVGNGQNIVNGDDSPTIGDRTDFGSTVLGAPVAHTFTIENSGEAALSVSGVTITGANAGEFSVTTAPSAVLAVNDSTAFTITYNPSVVGTHTATIEVENDDNCESSVFTFDIVGIAENTSGLQEVENVIQVYTSLNTINVILSETTTGNIRVLDMTGRVVLSQNITSDRTTIDSRSIGTGIYVVEVAAEKSTISRKVIVY